MTQAGPRAGGSEVVVHRADVVVPVVDATGRPVSPVPEGAVAVRDGDIIAVGPAARVRSEVARLGPLSERVWTGVLTPGLVNAHTHLQYTLDADLATTGLPFPAWIARIMARRAEATDERWAAAAAHGCALLLASGTTAVADVVTDSAALSPVGASALGGVSYLETLGWSARTWQDSGRAEYLGRLAEARTSGRTIGVMPHAPYTLDVDVMADVAATGRAQGRRVHTHLAESDAENDYVAHGTGRFADGAVAAGWDLALVAEHGSGLSPAAYLDRAGLLTEDLHVAHGVHCDAEDRAVLRARGVTVALCPRSNGILASGEPPVAAYLREDSPIALGTDSLASSPSLDLLDEARAAAALARHQGYDRDDLAARLVLAATYGGARALGRHLAREGQAPIGGLYPGARADLAVFTTDGSGLRPADDLLADGRCAATIVGGVVITRRDA